MADLSRSMAGVFGSTLVIAVPGSVSGATESLEAVEPVLDHALETLGGHTQHDEEAASQS
jgi:molybdopterin biosynthesis enzyme MoaB